MGGRRVPKHLANSKRSFIQRLSNAQDKSTGSAFFAFPSSVSFDGQEGEENIVLVVRQHPAVFLPQMIIVVLLLLGGFVSPSLLGDLSASIGPAMGTGIFFFFLIVAIAVAYDSFIRWYFTVNIITDQRIIDLNFINILYHEFSEAQLEKVEDVSHEVSGLFGMVFDYGTVTIQTAGTNPEFAFENVPRPRDVQDTISDLMEMKQNKVI